MWMTNDRQAANKSPAMARSTDAARREADRLRQLLDEHNHRYHVLDTPTISDADYDQLFRQLEKLEAAHPTLRTPTSPTQRVGAAPQSNFATVTHRRQMLSLGNVTTREELAEFDARVRKLAEIAQVTYTCEPKMAGVALELVYDDGALVVGSTRGDGITGEDVTVNVRTIRTVPLRLRTDVRPVPRRLEVRGEVYLPLAPFQHLNREREEAGEPRFANPRNATAGSLKQLDPRITASRPLDVVCHGVGELDGASLTTHADLLQAFSDWGLKVVPQHRVCASVDEVATFFAHLEAERDRLPFEIDGLVVKVNDLKLQRQLGQVSRSPRWAVAWKFAPRQATTRVANIFASVGRTGVLTPAAEVEPVAVGGVTVRNASLHNMDEVERKDIRIGDTIVIERAGDVIPYVVRALPEQRTGAERKFVMPGACPICGAEVVRPEGEVAYRCIGLDCPAKLKQGLQFFGARTAMDIEGLGEKLVEQLVDHKLVEDLAGLYHLDEARLIALERMGKKSAQNLLAGIERSKQAPLARFVTALGIRQVGEATAKALAEHFHTLDTLVAADEAALQAVRDIGPEVAASIHRFLSESRNRDVIDRLRAAGVEPQPVEPQSGPLIGKKFVLTGGMEGMTRLEAQRHIEAQGGRVVASVSKETDFVVVGAEPGAKFKKAEKLGIAVLDEAAFRALVGA